MATVLNGTLADQRFLDDDDDSCEDDPLGDIVCDAVSIPIPSTIVVACEDDPSYLVDMWYDCHQEDDAVSGPDDIVTASSNSAPCDFLEDADVSGPDEDATASINLVLDSGANLCLFTNPDLLQQLQDASSNPL